MNVKNIVPEYQTTTQIPNILREILLNAGYGKTALLLDLLFVLGYVGGQKVTYNEILAIAGSYTSHNIIREGLLCFAIKRVKVSSGRRGRPTYAYIIPSIAQLRGIFCDGILSPTDVLHVADMANMTTYRRALHRELIYRGCSESLHGNCSFSRAYMASRLGVSENTIRAYEKTLKIHVEPQFEQIFIGKSQDLVNVPAKKSHDGKMLEAYRQRDEKWLRLPADRGIAGYYLKQGYVLTLYARKPNKYYAFKPFTSHQVDNMPF